MLPWLIALKSNGLQLAINNPQGNITMSKFYENGFYETQNAENSRIEISDKKWLELLQNQTAGQNIVMQDDELRCVDNPNKEPDYIKNRRLNYPKIENFLDANVKINSDDVNLQNDGKRQMQEYIQTCLDVKKQYPKE